MCSGFVSTMIFRISLLFISERTCLYESGSACRRLTSMSRIFGDLTNSRSFTNPENRSGYVTLFVSTYTYADDKKCKELIFEDTLRSRRHDCRCQRERIVRDLRQNYSVGRLMARKPVNRAIRRNQYSPAPK